MDDPGFCDTMTSVWGMWLGVSLEYQGHLSGRRLGILEISALEGYELETAMWGIAVYTVVRTVDMGDLS